MDENPDTFFADVFIVIATTTHYCCCRKGGGDAAAVDSHVYEFNAAESGYDLEDKGISN